MKQLSVIVRRIKLVSLQQKIKFIGQELNLIIVLIPLQVLGLVKFIVTITYHRQLLHGLGKQYKK